MLLSFAGAAGQLGPVMAAKDAMLAAPMTQILDEGISAGQFAAGDPRDAANAILGAAMIATLGRWDRGGDSGNPGFQRALASQLVRGVLAADTPASPV